MLVFSRFSGPTGVFVPLTCQSMAVSVQDSVDVDQEVAGAAEDLVAAVRRRVHDQPRVLRAAHELTDRDLDLQPRERTAEADVDALAEAEACAPLATTRRSASRDPAFGWEQNGNIRPIPPRPARSRLTSTDRQCGKEVGGLPYFQVSSVTPAANSTSVTMRAAYSEASKYLLGASPGTVAGDANGNNGVGTDRSRADNFTLTPATGGTRVGNAVTAVQGGERFEAISLTTPGTVVLSGAGITAKFNNLGSGSYKGYFISATTR